MLPHSCSPIQPVCVIAGVIIDGERLDSFTRDFLFLKRQFFPGMNAIYPMHLDRIRHEIKGSDLRANAVSGSRRTRRQAIGFLDKSLRLLEESEARFIGRIWIKGIGTPLKPKPVYTSSIQRMCEDFQQYLLEEESLGIVIADSRTPAANTNVAHSIFTQLYRSAGNDLDRLVEMPVFGHSNNHAGLQAADLLASAFLFPMATYAYCSGHVTSLHVKPQYKDLQDRFGARIQKLQYRYQIGGKWKGGLTVSDGIGRRSGKLLFEPELSL